MRPFLSRARQALLALFVMSTTPLFAVQEPLELNYGETVPQRLELYLPSPARTAPVLVYIHGGAWISGDKSEYRFLAQSFVQDGIAVAVINYRLAGDDTRYPAFVEDAILALRFLHEKASTLGISSDQIFLMGHSAGAHTAAGVAFDPQLGGQLSFVRGYIGVEGIYDLPALVQKWPEYRAWFVRSAFGADEANWKRGSPSEWTLKKSAPWLLLHSPTDELVDQSQTDHFYARLVKSGIPADVRTDFRQTHFGTLTMIADRGSDLHKAIVRFTRNPSALGAR